MAKVCLLMPALPDAHTILIDGLNTMQWHAMGQSIRIKILKKIMVTGDKTDVVQWYTHQFFSPVIEKGQLKPSFPKHRVPVNTIK